MKKTTLKHRHFLIWLAIATALTLLAFIILNMFQVSYQSWGALNRVSPRQLNYLDKFDRVVQDGVIGYLTDLNSTDITSLSEVSALNIKYQSIKKDAEAFKKSCPERDIAVKQAEFYEAMLSYEQGLADGEVSEMESSIVEVNAKVKELISLMQAYGYAVETT